MPIKATKKDGYGARSAVKVLAIDPSGGMFSVLKGQLPEGWHLASPEEIAARSKPKLAEPKPAK